jgi:hypothetical protein
VTPGARVHQAAGGAVLIELPPLPPARPGLPGLPLPRAGWRARASGGDAAAAIDGDLATHWTSAVERARGGGWIEVDFGAERELDRLRLELGAHYGEYPRAWRVLAWRDGPPAPLAARRFAPAPLVSYRADHHRIVLDLPLPRTRARGVRVEVPPLARTGRPPPFDVPADYWGWRRWGVHELSAFAGAGPSGVGPAGVDAEADGPALDREAEVRIERDVQPAREVVDGHLGDEPVR